MTLSVKRWLRWLHPVPLLAALVALNGLLFLHPTLKQAQLALPGAITDVNDWKSALELVGLLEIPRFMLGISLPVMAVGLLLRARLAWAFSLLLLLAVLLLSRSTSGNLPGLQPFTLGVMLLLFLGWRSFHRASLAAGSLFALVSISSLMLYSVLGSLWLGSQFSPPIASLTTAFYYAIVSMSTAGFGDIVPQTADARLFTVSIIVLGITVFATSLTAVIGPAISGNLKRLVRGRMLHMMRKNHTIIAGATPLAHSVYDGLRQRGETPTVIVPERLPHQYPPDADIIVGDATLSDVLQEAGVARAKTVLALRGDDSENAFIVLAVKEVAGSGTRTVSLVNDSQHLQKIRRVQPDMLFSLQMLGSEFLVRSLNGEPLDSRTLTDLFFGLAEPGEPGSPRQQR
ncbi:voltage-gated potassium channel protein [Pantoea sp. 1.19]|uniref:voltage-gated potassium channel protein n=1 Tax=Pantoea sp. 1.19 TaxID=1925589 RepID=UPI0009488F68|nr:voltage-gated potassium channel protein [Pantoea sp. 1.19]